MQPAIVIEPSDPPFTAVSHTDTAALLDFLSTRDVPCPSCKYNLRGLTLPRCPECGGTLRLTVGLIDLPMGAWICAIAAILPASPFGLLIFLLVFFSISKGMPVNIQKAQIWPLFLIVYALMAFPAAIGLLVFRRAYMRLPQGVQGIVATTAIVVDIAALITFLSLL